MDTLSDIAALSRMDNWDTKELAAYLRHTVRTVAGWRGAGTGPRYVQAVPGGRVIYRRADVEEWLASRVVGSTSEVSVKAQKAEKEVSQ